MRKAGSRFFTAAALLALFAAGCNDGGTTAPTDPPPPPPPPPPATTFDIGENDPRIIVAFGDSISDGYDSADGAGYRSHLERLYDRDKRAYIRVLDEGEPGTYTQDGANRIDAVLARDTPAVLILLYGTNDELKGYPRAAYDREAYEREVLLPTSEYMRRIALTARANKTIVVLSTIPPVCGIARIRQRENIVLMNEKIRQLAAELGTNDLGIRLADAWDAFLTRGAPDGCSFINMDHGNHPNDQGYALLAETYHDALRGMNW